MRLLRICVNGLPAFENGKIDIDFITKQRVTEFDRDQLSQVGNAEHLFTNNVIGFAGINASGKTTVLMLISFVLRLITNKTINLEDDINENYWSKVFRDFETADFTIYMLSKNNKCLKLCTQLEHDQEGKFIITKEKIYKKNVTKNMSKKMLFEFPEKTLFLTRDDIKYLPDDISIIIVFNRDNEDGTNVIDRINITNFNILTLYGNYPEKLIHFLDPTIEYIHLEKMPMGQNGTPVSDVKLKFYNRDPITLSNVTLLNNYLSSGTIKGIGLFLEAKSLFERGGYLILDEIENHFNYEIVVTLIRYFMNSGINKSNAVLLFSTHYLELLDEFERNDNINIVRNKSGITVVNLSRELDRNDVNKSDVFKSGYLGGTSIQYNQRLDLTKSLKGE